MGCRWQRAAPIGLLLGCFAHVGPAAADTLSSEVVAAENAPGLQGYIARETRKWAESDIIFTRGFSLSPFLPLGYLGSTRYGDASVIDAESGKSLQDFSLQSYGQAGGIPFLVDDNSAFGVGDYISHSRFSTSSGEDFTVTSVGIGAGWLEQLSPEWQAAAFILPVWHTSTYEDGNDYIEAMGGVFARYTQSSHLWWVFGAFADVSPFDDYLIPYVGVSWMLDERWSVSGIMPWPSINYSPDADQMWSLGGSISGAGWSLDQTGEEIGMDFSAFDLGLRYQRRLSGALWGGLSIGTSGLKVFGIRDGSADFPEFDVSRSPFISLNLTLRPTL